MPKKYCFVPQCSNTSVNMPHKKFIFVPRVAELRNRWTKALCRRDISVTSSVYICEDHFNLKEDAKNWEDYEQSNKLLPIKLKTNVLPRLVYSTSANTIQEDKSPMKPGRRRKEIEGETVLEKKIKVPNKQLTATNTHSEEEELEYYLTEKGDMCLTATEDVYVENLSVIKEEIDYPMEEIIIKTEEQLQEYDYIIPTGEDPVGREKNKDDLKAYVENIGRRLEQVSDILLQKKIQSEIDEIFRKAEFGEL